MCHATENQFVLNCKGVRANADRFVEKPGQPTYRASGLRRAGADFRLPKSIPTAMKAKGVIVDGVAIDGIILSDWLKLGVGKMFTSRFRKTFGGFWLQIVVHKGIDLQIGIKEHACRHGLQVGS